MQVQKTPSLQLLGEEIDTGTLQIGAVSLRFVRSRYILNMRQWNPKKGVIDST